MMHAYFSSLLSKSAQNSTLRVERRQPRARDACERYRSVCGRGIPENLVQFYEVTDGLSVNGELLVPPLDDLVEYGFEPGLFLIHDWGNGDADCCVETASGGCLVLFCDHNQRARHPLARGLHFWLSAVLDEFMLRGEYQHPIDYLRTDCYNAFRGITNGIVVHD